MGVIDQTGTMVNLAKAMLMDLDRESIETKVKTATLELLLRTIVDLGEPARPTAQADHARSFGAMMAARGDG